MAARQRLRRPGLQGLLEDALCSDEVNNGEVTPTAEARC